MANENRDKTALIFAGGQIIHKIDVNGEAVPISKEEVLSVLSSEVKENLNVLDWSYQPVCHYSLRMCSDLIQLAGAQIEDGASGVVITSGTQALTEAAYFADLVWSYPQPLVFTSSSNYAFSEGTETSLHLTQSIRAASSQTCWGQGVLVCSQDSVFAASEITQFCSYNRSVYFVPDCGPVAAFMEPGGEVVFFHSPRRGKVMSIETTPARHVEIVDVSLGGGDILLNALLDGKISELDGLVLSAFGSGDVPPSWVPLLRKIMKSVPVVLASRVPCGCVRAGADFEGCAARMLELGLISAGSFTPLQARIRLAVALGAELNDQELRSYMLGE